MLTKIEELALRNQVGLWAAAEPPKGTLYNSRVSMRVSRVLAFVSDGRAPVVRQRMGSSAHAGLC